MTEQIVPPKANEWQSVCPLAAVEIERGVSALVRGRAIAIFRSEDGKVYALGNYDPLARRPSSPGGLWVLEGGRVCGLSDAQAGFRSAHRRLLTDSPSRL